MAEYVLLKNVGCYQGHPYATSRISMDGYHTIVLPHRRGKGNPNTPLASFPRDVAGEVAWSGRGHGDVDNHPAKEAQKDGERRLKEELQRFMRVALGEGEGEERGD